MWLGHEDFGAPVPLPTLADVLYTRPNPNGSRKLCRNCLLWMQDMLQCFIHDSSIPVPADAVCGYHVYGKPMTAGPLSRENMDPVQPEHSGLERIPGGTSCDICKFYSPRGQVQGTCRAVRDPEAGTCGALVQALGCCSRWTERDA